MLTRRDMNKLAALTALSPIGTSAVSGQTTDTTPQHVITLKQAHRGTLEIDMDLLNSYGSQPERIQAFFAKARTIFGADRKAGFAGNTAFQAAAEKHHVKHLGGPMLGCMDSDQASVWVRTVKPAQVQIKVNGPDGQKVFGPVPSSAETELSAVVRLTGLEPATQYRYQVYIDGHPLELQQNTTFTTFPSCESKGTFKVAFGGDFHKVGLHNVHLLKQVRQRGNRAMLLTGDLAVDDRNADVGLHRSDYLLRDLSPAWQTLAASVPLYAVWDDHDYFDNDLSGIPKNFTADDVRAVRQVWAQNWNNPVQERDGEGIYFRTRLGPADVIMLDTRSLRKKKQKTPNAFLGDEQMRWLKAQLLACRGPFVIVASPTMWSDYVSAGKDSWGVWDTVAREEIFAFIEQHRIPGVLLITCDRHGARGFTIARPGGYRFYEFEIGTLGGMTGPPAMGKDAADAQLFGRVGIKAFGEFEFNTAPADPQVIFRLVDETGSVLEKITLSQSELTPGQ